MCRLEVDEQAVVRHLIESHQLNKNEQRAVQGAQTVQELHLMLSELETRTDQQYALLVFVISNFQDYSVNSTARNRLQSRLPKIAHFTEYMRMPGQLSINDLKWRQENDALEDGHRVFLALLDMIDRGVDDLEQIEQHEMLTAELEGAEVGWEKWTPKSDKLERRRCQDEEGPARKVYQGIPAGSSEAGIGRESVIARGRASVVLTAIDVGVLGEAI